MNYCDDLMGSKPTHYNSQCFKSGHSYTELTGDNCKVQRQETIAFILCAYGYCSHKVQLVHFLGKECTWVSSMNIASHLGWTGLFKQHRWQTHLRRHRSQFCMVAVLTTHWSQKPHCHPQHRDDTEANVCLPHPRGRARLERRDLIWASPLMSRSLSL